jgi:UDP-N-acetylglucosamine--dolichyl-phosphate N-acetylglucosaminephosphotransferase
MNHAFSLLIMLPFIGTLLGYLNHNWYPASVFGGDVLPYYSGMTLAVAAMLGHFPKSLFLLMLPQLINFIYSLPQLFKIVPIPRHRLPRVNPKTGFLRPSKVAPNDERNNMTLPVWQ